MASLAVLMTLVACEKERKPGGKPLEITEVQIPTFGEGNEAEDLQAEVLKYLWIFLILKTCKKK